MGTQQPGEPPKDLATPLDPGGTGKPLSPLEDPESQFADQITGTGSDPMDVATQAMDAMNEEITEAETPLDMDMGLDDMSMIDEGAGDMDVDMDVGGGDMGGIFGAIAGLAGGGDDMPDEPMPEFDDMAEETGLDEMNLMEGLDKMVGGQGDDTLGQVAPDVMSGPQYAFDQAGDVQPQGLQPDDVTMLQAQAGMPARALIQPDTQDTEQGTFIPMRNYGEAPQPGAFGGQFPGMTESARQFGMNPEFEASPHGRQNFMNALNPNVMPGQVPQEVQRQMQAEEQQMLPPGGGGLMRAGGPKPVGPTGGEAPGMGKPLARTQGDIRDRLLSMREQRMLLDQAANNYQENFLTRPGQMKLWFNREVNRWPGIRDLPMIGLDEQEKSDLQGARIFNENLNRVFDRYRIDVTGAQAGMEELNKLKKSMLNPDLSPDEFTASFNNMQKTLRALENTYSDALSAGKNPTDTSDANKEFMNQRYLSNRQREVDAQGQKQQTQQQQRAAPTKESGPRRKRLRYNPATGQLE
jgi:hypothetical protein